MKQAKVDKRLGEGIKFAVLFRVGELTEWVTS